MDEFIKERIAPEILELPIDLASICVSKRIRLAEKKNPKDENKFILDNRQLIMDYHKLTGNYRNFVKNIITGNAIVSEEELEEYQRKDFVRVYTPHADKFALWDDYHPTCNDPFH